MLQLNRWSFTTIRGAKNSYRHQLFRKGELELCKRISLAERNVAGYDRFNVSAELLLRAAEAVSLPRREVVVMPVQNHFPQIHPFGSYLANNYSLEADFDVADLAPYTMLGNGEQDFQQEAHSLRKLLVDAQLMDGTFGADTQPINGNMLQDMLEMARGGSVFVPPPDSFSQRYGSSAGSGPTMFPSSNHIAFLNQEMFSPESSSSSTMMNGEGSMPSIHQSSQFHTTHRQMMMAHQQQMQMPIAMLSSTRRLTMNQLDYNRVLHFAAQKDDSMPLNSFE